MIMGITVERAAVAFMDKCRIANFKAGLDYPYDDLDMRSAFEAGVEWAYERPKNLWVSVKDRLPQESGWVFVAGGRNPYRALLYYAGLFSSDITLGTFDSGVTHWMPIVEPK